MYDINDLIEEIWEEPFFVRPFDMFNEKIKFEWKIIERFKYIYENN